MSTILSRAQRAALKGTHGGTRPNAGRPQWKSAEEKRATKRARDNRYNAKHRNKSLDRVATLDFETDPFDNKNPDRMIEPFLCVLYSTSFPTITLWRDAETPLEDYMRLVLRTIEELPNSYTIYAHNGGKFDYMFLLKYLRGNVLFKGAGIMTAQIGEHQIRDSMNICPGKLAKYKKDEIDYRLLARDKREKNKAKIIKYCISDCVYLHERVSHFLREHGFKLSIGQAAMAALKKSRRSDGTPMNSSNIRIGEQTDAWIRPFFFGGRSECIQGRVHVKTPLKLYDVNSMYSRVMAYHAHPIDGQFSQHSRQPTLDTIFIELECDNNGALISRIEETATMQEVLAGEAKGSVTCNMPHGVFQTTIWEYNVALRYGLISNIRIIRCIDFKNRTTFADFVLPRYRLREELKVRLEIAPENTAEYAALKLASTDIKDILNNAYGKFAQNPRRFKEAYMTNPPIRVPYTGSGIGRGKLVDVFVDQPPPDANGPWGNPHEAPYTIDGKRGAPGYTPQIYTDHYALWERPSPSKRYNNVATGASITGAARAVLLEGIQHAKNPLYCDTDSLLCEDLDASKVEIHQTKLGAWKLENEWTEAIIVAKKGYYLYNANTGAEKFRWKGAPAAALNRSVYERTFAGESVITVATGLTMTKNSVAHYQTRTLRATAKKHRTSASAEKD